MWVTEVVTKNRQLNQVQNPNIDKDHPNQIIGEVDEVVEEVEVVLEVVEGDMTEIKDLMIFSDLANLAEAGKTGVEMIIDVVVEDLETREEISNQIGKINSYFLR